MIRVQQISDLEARVLRAVDLIERLRAENRTLSAELAESRERLEESEGRSQQLEEKLASLRSDQENVEQIIVRTLDKLDGLEDAWSEQQDEPPAEQQDEPPAEQQDQEEQADETPADAAELPADSPPAPPDPPEPPPNPPGSGASAAGDGSFGAG